MWHRPAHRSSPALCHRPSGTDPSPGIASASPTRSLTTAAPDDLHTVETTGGGAQDTQKVSAVGPGAMLIAWDEIATLSDMI